MGKTDSQKPASRAWIALLLVPLGMWFMWRAALGPQTAATSPSDPDSQNVAEKAQGPVASRIISAPLDPAAASFPGSLEEIAQGLTGRTPADSASMIVRWLDTGHDAPTGLDFSLSPDGRLATAPTLRTHLLDQLQRIDPKAAGDYAKAILADSKSPDEWALSLRAHAMARPDDTEFLRQKSRELVRNKAWQTEPSIGYLEAFDVVVFNRDVDLAPDLAAMVRNPDNRALAHAAYLTMDRLVQGDTPAMLKQLQTQPELMAGRERTRADFISRADVRDVVQRNVVETYLLNPDLSPVELQQFAGVFPNANFRISRNLLTTSPTPGSTDLSARDRESLSVVQQWLNDPRFAGRRSALESIRQRLETFVSQTGNVSPR